MRLALWWPCASPWCLNLAPAAAVVKRGRIVEEGSHKELMERQQAYYTLVQMQQAQASLSDDDTDEDEEGAAGELPLGLPLAEHLATVAEEEAGSPKRASGRFSLEMTSSVTGQKGEGRMARTPAYRTSPIAAGALAAQVLMGPENFTSCTKRTDPRSAIKRFKRLACCALLMLPCRWRHRQCAQQWAACARPDNHSCCATGGAGSDPAGKLCWDAPASVVSVVLSWLLSPSMPGGREHCCLDWQAEALQPACSRPPPPPCRSARCSVASAACGAT